MTGHYIATHGWLWFETISFIVSFFIWSLFSQPQIEHNEVITQLTIQMFRARAFIFPYGHLMWVLRYEDELRVELRLWFTGISDVLLFV